MWAIEIGRPRTRSARTARRPRAAERASARSSRRPLAAVRELPQVEIAAGAFTGPYINAGWESGLTLADGRKVDYVVNRVTDDFMPLLSMPIVAGRGFSREDDATPPGRC